MLVAIWIANISKCDMVFVFALPKLLFVEMHNEKLIALNFILHSHQQGGRIQPPPLFCQ